MKRLAAILALSTGLIAGPALAGHEGVNILNKERVGGAGGGYVVGKKVAHNYQGASTQLASHKSRRYKSDRHRSSKRSHYRKDKRRHKTHTSHKPKIHPIDEKFVARTRSNVRSGPSTRFRVIDQLHYHERVRVIGKVHGRNWYMVRTHHGKGFVYAPLLAASHGAHGGHHGYKRHDKHDRGGYRHYRGH